MAEERMLNDEILLGLIKANGGGGGGTKDYSQLDNKPQINGNTLTGNKSAADLGLQKELTAGDNITIEEDGTISAESGASYTAGDYVSINNNTVGVTLEKGQPDVYSYKFVTTSTSDYTPSVKVQKYLNGTLVDETNYENSEVRTPVEFDGRIRFWYGEGGGFVWSYRNLVASNEHVNPTTTTWAYNQTVEYEETFDVFNQSTKLATQGYVDTALSGKQDTLTFDDVPTDNSNNPVKSNGIYDALALKQNATDNSLETDAKTIVGAINEHEGDISSLKSGLTNLDNEVNGDATVYPYADVITIPDAIPANVADCTVKIEPDQNLHGYDHPWVGGAGKNKLPLILADIKAANTSGTWSGNVYTINGDTIEVLVDSDNNVLGFKINKTHNKAISFNIFDNKSYVFDGSYDFVGESVLINGELAYTYTFDNTSIDITNPNGVTQVVDDNLNHVHIYIWAAKTYTNQIVTPMVCLSSETDKSFAPYTNYCPITGHTEASVQRDGKNLFDKNNAGNLTGRALNSETGEPYVTSGWMTSSFIKIDPSTTYTLTTTSASSSVAFYDSAKAYISGAASFGTKTTPSNAKYLRFDYKTENADIIQLELGSTATPYVPYASKTYTIALGDTIYGGTVDFNSGVMTVDRAVVDLGTLNYTYNATDKWYNSPISNMKLGEVRTLTMLCECYQCIDDGRPFVEVPDSAVWNGGNSGNVYIRDTRYTDPSDLTTALDGIKLVYPIATPLTVQLTPTQIQLLKGTNTLTASTGQISVTVNGVSGSIGAVQEQVNDTDAALAELAADIAEQLPTAPTTDGAYVLTVTVADGTPTYSWESAT